MYILELNLGVPLVDPYKEELVWGIDCDTGIDHMRNESKLVEALELK